MFLAAYRRNEADPGSGGGRSRRAKVGVVLGAGAARGWAHIGAMQELDALGLKPDVVVGSSIGSLVGGCYAAGRLDMLEVFARSLTRRRVLGLLDFSFTGGGLFGGERLRARLEAALGGHSNRGSADPVRRRRDRNRRRARDLAQARLPGRCDPRFLRVARGVRAGQGRWALAVRRRDRQSGAGQRRPRAWRRARHRAQHFQRQRRARNGPSGPVRAARSRRRRRTKRRARAAARSRDGGAAERSGPALTPTRMRRPRAW